MGFKKMDSSLGFADLALASSLKHNRSLKLMEKLDKSIEWSRIEAILLSHYTVGASGEGADAYPPMPLSIPTTAKLTEYEIERNKKISKVRYIVEQYFGISHLKDHAKRVRFTDIAKNKFDGWYRQASYNIRPLHNSIKIL